MNNGIIAVLGVVILGSAVGMQMASSQKTATLIPAILYIAIDSSSDVELEIAQRALGLIHQGQPPYQRLIVDVMTGDGLSNLYSDEMGKDSIKEIYRHLAITEASSESFVQSIHRASLLRSEEILPEQALHVLILSSGIRDKTRISAVQEEASGLSQYSNFMIYVVGLEAEDSLSLSRAFSDIPEHIEFSGQLPSELEIVINKLGEAHQ